MAYGRSANWVGRVPAASQAAEFTIAFQCVFRTLEGTETRDCTFSVQTHQTERIVAPLHRASWNNKNGGGAENDPKDANGCHRVSFGGEILEMGVKGYRSGTEPPRDFKKVEFGEKTEVLPGSDEGEGLYVFNA